MKMSIALASLLLALGAPTLSLAATPVDCRPARVRVIVTIHDAGDLNTVLFHGGVVRYSVAVKGRVAGVVAPVFLDVLMQTRIGEFGPPFSVSTFALPSTPATSLNGIEKKTVINNAPLIVRPLTEELCIIAYAHPNHSACGGSADERSAIAIGTDEACAQLVIVD